MLPAGELFPTGEAGSGDGGNSPLPPSGGDSPGGAAPSPSSDSPGRNNLLEGAMLLFDAEPSLRSLHELCLDESPSKTS